MSRARVVDNAVAQAQVRMDLVAQAASPQVAERALMSAVRWLALLPAEWKPELLELMPGGSAIVVRLMRGESAPAEAVWDSARTALSDPALQGWELVACRAVA